MKKHSILLTLISLIAFISCNKEPQVDNIIYLIGDGMGLGSISALVLSEDQATGFERGNPVIGFSETCSANNYVTDSPAGGTALATGTRTKNGYLGVDPEGNQLKSVMKDAQEVGKKSAIVVNTVLTEATPASFYGGVLSRSQGYDLAKQFTTSGVDVAIGSGLSVFINRPDSVDLTETLINDGYDVYLDWRSVLNTTSDKYVGILPMGDIHRRNESTNTTAGAADGAEVCLAAKLAASTQDENREEGYLSEPDQYLCKATAKALETLDRISDNGFFLMIESAIIDGYGHNNDSVGLIEEMKEFNQTLNLVVDYVNNNPNTLLVVVADHETGGANVTYKSYEVGGTSPVEVSFSTKGHTGTLVPIFAYGAGADEFAGIMKNTDVADKIRSLITK